MFVVNESAPLVVTVRSPAARFQKELGIYITF